MGRCSTLRSKAIWFALFSFAKKHTGNPRIRTKIQESSCTHLHMGNEQRTTRFQFGMQGIKKVSNNPTSLTSKLSGGPPCFPPGLRCSHPHDMNICGPAPRSVAKLHLSSQPLSPGPHQSSQALHLAWQPGTGRGGGLQPMNISIFGWFCNPGTHQSPPPGSTKCI